jgi:hypothetical protein
MTLITISIRRMFMRLQIGLPLWQLIVYECGLGRNYAD